MKSARVHTTIGLKKDTKNRLDKRRAPGQCYDGFLCQLLDLWDESIEGTINPSMKIRQIYKEVAHKS